MNFFFTIFRIRIRDILLRMLIVGLILLPASFLILPPYQFEYPEILVGMYRKHMVETRIDLSRMYREQAGAKNENKHQKKDPDLVHTEPGSLFIIFSS